MAYEYEVEVLESFAVRYQAEATMNSRGKYLPAINRIVYYKAGEKRKFTSKRAALAWEKHHGPKVRYLGRV